MWEFYTKKISKRNNNTLLIWPLKSKTNYVYISSKIWNKIVKTLFKEVILSDIKFGGCKAKLKRCLLELQGRFDEIEWYKGNLDVNQLKRDSWIYTFQRNETKHGFPRFFLFSDSPHHISSPHIIIGHKLPTCCDPYYIFRSIDIARFLH